MPHLNDELIEQAAAGTLPPADAARLRAHTDACPTCRQRLAQARSSPTTLTPHSAPAAATEATLTVSRTVGAAPPPPPRVGRYLVVKELGAGGMGRVYSAYDPELDRRIAIKILHPEPDDGRPAAHRRDRLLREAQAMARLAHPNVIPVHDVGTVGDSVFFAMERVDGGTLRDWMRQRRPWRDVVALFVQAGRGLAAAHAAGIVHRDFKPENVLIGKDERVRVTDFGVARALETPSQSEGGGTTPPGLGPPLTYVGQLVGTPGYLAPEQLDGRVTEKTDQFSFCVALFEALVGQRPFDRAAFEDYAEELRRKKAEFPANNPTPGFVRDVVLRGLDKDPERRFPSMTALLEALGRDPRARRLRWAALAVLAAGALLVGGGALAVRAAQERACRQQAGWAASLWESSRPGVASAFRALQKPYAAQVLGTVESGLTAFVRDWGAARGAVCRGTAPLPDAERAASSACLDMAGQTLDEAIKLLRRTDEAVVQNAALMVASLPLVRDCLDADALASVPPPPPEPTRAAAVAAARVRLARATILAIPSPQDGMKEVRALLPEIERQDYPAALAEAYFVLAEAENKADLTAEAEASLKRAAELAVAGRDDRLFIKAASRMAYIVGGFHEQPARAADWMGLARRAFERLGRPDALAGWLDLQETGVQIGLGRWDECGKAAERAAAAAARHGDRVAETEAVSQYAFCTRKLSTAEEAIRASQRVLERETATFGPDHPLTAETRSVLCRLYWQVGEHQRALPLCEGALPVARALGRPTVQLAMGLEQYAKILSALDREPEALAARQEALAVFEQSPHKRGTRPWILAGLASSEHRLGQRAQALRRSTEAAAICDDPPTEERFDSNCAWARFVHAQLLLDHGARAQAQRQAARSRALYARALNLRPMQERVEAWARSAGLTLPPLPAPGARPP